MSYKDKKYNKFIKEHQQFEDEINVDRQKSADEKQMMIECAKTLEKRLKDRIKDNEIKLKHEIADYQDKEQEWIENENKYIDQIKE